MSSRSRLLVLLALLAATVGGCASGKLKEANDYVTKVNQAQTGFAASSDRLLTQITPDSPSAKDRAVLSQFYSAVDGFVAKLRAIDPPASVRALHERLIGAIVRFGTSLRTAGDDITSKQAARILDGQQELAKATAGVSGTINTTIARINAALKK